MIKQHPLEPSTFYDTAMFKQQAYEESRRGWRIHHPLVTKEQIHLKTLTEELEDKLKVCKHGHLLDTEEKCLECLFSIHNASVENLPVTA